MAPGLLIDQLERQRAVFASLFSGLRREEILWKPAPEKWCLLEVICHLYDEEHDDFAARLKHVLATPEAPLPPTDPIGWVTARRYIEQDFATMLDRFLQERDATIAWLRGVNEPLWKNTHVHPKVGPISAELFLVNWVAHDLLHIRQINRLQYGYLEAHSREPLDYAGPW